MKEEESDELTRSHHRERVNQLAVFVRIMVRDEMLVGGDNIGGDDRDMKNKGIERES